jgi:radical SAM protein with 4Fe4S-binding SPASM domain
MAHPIRRTLLDALRHPHHAGHQIRKNVRFLRRLSWIRKNKKKCGAVPAPLAYGIELTSKCNLRCPMCYEWGERGWYSKGEAGDVDSGEELDWRLLQRIMSETSEDSPYYTFWGGEPLLYSRFSELTRLVKRLKCFGYVCTNGTLLDRYSDELSSNPYLSYVVSLDGLEKENDKIRGKGHYRRVTESIRRIKRGKSPYLGVTLTIMPHNLPVLDRFCTQMCDIGFDWIQLNMRWFISDSQKDRYEQRVKKEFGIAPTKHLGYHDPAFDLDRTKFIEQYRLVQKSRLPIPVNWMPPLPGPNGIHGYIDRPETPLTHGFCNKQWIQADINRFGQVVACKNWPDIIVGDLRDESIKNIWNSERYAKFRKSLVSDGLLPICSKCYALYLYGKRI